MKRTTFILATIVAITTFICGCSNYKLAGTPVDLPFSSVYVQPVKNKSLAPQATNLLTNSISTAIVQTPDLRLGTADEHQATLETSLIEYKRNMVATRREDTALAESYRVEAIAECSLRRSNGEYIFKNRKVRAFVTVYPNASGVNDLIGNEYQNMPVLMRELGFKIRDAVIGIW